MFIGSLELCVTVGPTATSGVSVAGVFSKTLLHLCLYKILQYHFLQFFDSY